MSDIEVRVGQVWADKDYREANHGRRQRLRVDYISPDGLRADVVNEDIDRISTVSVRQMKRRFRLVDEGAVR